MAKQVEMAEKSNEKVVKSPLQSAIDSARPYLDKLRSLMRQIRPHIIALLPYLDTAWKRSYQLYCDYWKDGYGEILWCLLLIYFGGQFALTILAAQAFDQAGGSIIRSSLAELKTTYRESMSKLQSDPDAKSLFDKDGDGTVTIEEVIVSFGEVLTSEDPKVQSSALRMTSVGLRCIDPNRLLEASVGFWAGFVAVIATLKSNLAKSVSNGAMIGDHLLRSFKVFLEKPLYERFPGHKDWVDVGLKAGFGLIGISFALLVVRVVSAFNSALNGAHRLADILMRAARIRGLLKLEPTHEATANQALIVFFVFSGINWQLSTGFSLPWYLRIALLPLSLFETTVSLVSAY